MKASYDFSKGKRGGSTRRSRSQLAKPASRFGWMKIWWITS